MSANYKTLSDYEVATAEEAQSYFMDQAIIKVDADTDLAALPTTVKTAYILNTGILMARNVANAWVPMGGVATVNETAPANPQVGSLWIKPSEVLPAPVRGYAITSTKNVTATAWANVALDSAKSIVLPKAAVCYVAYKLQANGSSGTPISIRMAWNGATSGDTYTQMGGIMGATAVTSTAGREQYVTTVALGAGTTNFTVEAQRSNTSASTSIDSFAINVTPIAWADQYAAGVS